MTFNELCERSLVIAEKKFGGRIDLVDWDEGDFNRIVESVLEALDFHVSDNGEVCDPRPTPLAPRQQNVHWAGAGRKRRR